ncbi:MAG: biotin-dependent carboxyltransferase family protein [Gemmataceae bacterium]|nr:biotin-dependent carboxyltransferase family protein [Gemmataceae bacterium]
MSLRVIHAGPHSLLVDAGRPGWRALGVPVGGAADRAALAIGNALAGNPPDAPAVEFTLAGPTLEAEHPTAGGVFGAPFAVSVNARPVPAGTTFALEPGDTLTVGGTPAGARGYLCVAGGFDGPAVLGSRSALEPLRPGDVLPCPPSRCEPRGLGFPSLPSPLEGEGGGRRPPGEGKHFRPPTPGPSPSRGEGRRIRVLDGPQRDWFSDERFFTQDYTVTPAADRMGVRLVGEPLARRPGELVSEAVAPGAVQVTNDGRPVVLGVDGQTIGGYPKVAHVVRADLDRVGQLRPGDRVRFVRVTAEEAEAAARERAAVVRGWLARLRAADRAPVVG